VLLSDACWPALALQIVSVDAAAGVLVLGGVDIVDGSPVLDIKPYVPFCDALPDAVAPDWVTVRGMLQGVKGKADTKLKAVHILRGRHPCRCFIASLNMQSQQ
jgi:hypothetical protein